MLQVGLLKVVPSPQLSQLNFLLMTSKYLYLKMRHESCTNKAWDVLCCHRKIHTICGVADSWDLKLNVNKFSHGSVRQDGICPSYNYYLHSKNVCFKTWYNYLWITDVIKQCFPIHIRSAVRKTAILSAIILKATVLVA